MKRVFVHGLMEQHAPAFATGFLVDVQTVREASQVIEANYPGFYAFVAQMPMEVILDHNHCHPAQLDMRRPTIQEIHFRPVEAGQGKVGMIILGVALLASAVFTMGTSLAAGAGLGLTGGLFGSGVAAGLGLTAGFSALMGTTLLAGALMSPATADYKNREKPDARSSALISGTINPQEEGSPVPLCVGLDVMCEGTTIHRSLDAESMIQSENTPIVVTPEPPQAPPDEPDEPISEALAPGTYGSGKSKKKSKGPVEGANTLQAKMLYREVRVLSEGVIGGLATGDERSIIVNGTPLSSMDDAGNLVRNHKGFSWAIRYGTEEQSRFDGFTAVERQVEGWTKKEVKKGNLPTDSSYTPSIYTVQDPDVDAVKVTLQTAGAFQHQDDESGSTYGTKVTLRVMHKPASDITWYEAAPVVFDGKSSGPFPKIVRIPKPDDSLFDDPDNLAWDVKVERLTDDTDSRYESDQIDWVAISEVLDHRNTYPGTALFMFEADSVSFPQIPKVVLRLTGISCEVPSNYDAETRTYGLTWDFRWKWAYTDNPSYITRTLLRHYCNPTIPNSYLDNSEFYLAGKWCDGMVDNGDGGVEPRYTVNEYMASEEDAIAWIQTLAATYNAQAWFGNGELHITQDRPRVPVMPVHPGNVVNGELKYQSISVSEQITTANVSYHDLDNDWKFSPEPYTDEAEEARWKSNEKNISICTNSRGQAARMGKYCVVTSKTEDEKLMFRGGFHHALAFPGTILSVANPKRMGAVQDGRILGATTNSVTLDQTVELDAETDYTVFLVSEDGESLVETAVLNAPGETDTLQIETLTYTPGTYYTWMLGGTGVVPEKFRVLSNRQVQDDQWEITALKYNPNKWAEIEEGLILEPEKYSKLDTGASLLPPTNPVVKMLMLTTPQGQPTANLEISWTPSVSPFVTEYRVSYRLNSANAVELPTSQTNFATIHDAAPGEYEIRVVSVNIAGSESANPMIVSYQVEYGTQSELFPPTNLRTAQGGTTWTGQDLVIQWDDNAYNTLDVGVVASYEVTILNEDQSVRRVMPLVDPTVNTTTYTYAMNLADGLTSRLRVSVKSVDAMNGTSSAITQILYNPAPSLPAITNTDSDLTGFRIEHAQPTDPDFVGLAIWYSSDPDFVPTADNVAKMDAGLVHDVEAPQATDLTVWYAAYDSFGIKPISRLNLSPPFDVSTADTEYAKPETILDLAVDVIATETSVQASLSWTPVDDVTAYDIEVIANDGLAQIVNATSNPHVMSLQGDTNYKWRIRGKNVYVPGEWSNQVEEDTPSVSGAYDAQLTSLDERLDDLESIGITTRLNDLESADTSLDSRLDALEEPIMGWADPTGVTSKDTFSTDGVSLPDLSARFAQLILDLKAKGILDD
jgi:predicted phage tail protein